MHRVGGDEVVSGHLPAGAAEAAPGDGLDRFLARTTLVWVLAVASVGIAVGFAVSRIWRRPTLDLEVYLMGARHLVDGRLYDVRGTAVPHLAFTYTPFAALFFTPLAPLPFGIAQLLWAVISMAALISMIALSLWAVRPDIAPRRLWLLSLVLLGPISLFEPILLNFHFLQVNFVLDLVVFTDLLLVLRVRGRTVPRGLLVGIAAAVKLIPLIFVVYLVITRQFRAAAVAVSTFVCCTVIGALFNIHASWLYWSKYAYDAKRVGGVYYLSNQSLRGALDRLTHTDLRTSIVTAGSAVVLVAGIALARWAYVGSSTLLAVLVTATTGMLVSPITWSHHLVWCIPILAWLTLAKDRPRGGRIWAAGASIVLWMGPIWFVPSNPAAELDEHGFGLVMANAYFFLMALFLLGVAAMLAVRASRSARAGAAHRDPSAPGVTAQI